MSTPLSAVSDEARAAARDLLEQRSQLEAWLSRLDDQATDVPAHIAERVRNDYAQRLDQVTSELAGHLDAIRESLITLRADLAAAEDRYRAEADELEEARLRHMLGELSDPEWEDRRTGLDAAVGEAERERADVQEEVDRLAGLVAEIDSSASATAEPEEDVDELPMLVPEPMEQAPPEEQEASVEQTPPAEQAPPQLQAAPEEAGGQDDSDIDFDEMFAEWSSERGPHAAKSEPAASAPLPEPISDIASDGLDDLAFLREIGVEPEPPAPRTSGAPSGDDDFAFLEELDRAIAASGQPAAGAAAEPTPAAGASAEADLLCKTCGAMNDPRAWYCEVCGADLT